jgi:diguanylate cyclase (GGDEF)-like protein
VASVLLLEHRRDTITWTLLTCAAIAAYGTADMSGFDFPMLYDSRFRDFFDTICIAGLAIILSWIAFMFDRNRAHAMATITEQKVSLQNALAEIAQLAYYDALTQLPNRRLFMDRLNQALADNKRNGRYAALMFLDLDNFKMLNDTCGHEAGDLLLTQAAQRLTRCMREIDTVARFGGDEFAVILSSLGTDLEIATARAKIVAAKVSATLAEPYALTARKQGAAAEPATHECTASIGVVLFLNHEGEQKELLIWADAAMYQAKSFGKGSIYFHTAGNSDRMRSNQKP